ncbi:MAG: DMT family transporter [Rhodobiaceae bacterium]|nr:DMT family transporter [Rhodobiaceae bacterium]
MPPSPKRPDWLAYAVLTVMPLMFSSNLVIGRAAMETMAPATLAFWRWAIAALVMVPFTWRAMRRNAGPISEAALQFPILGLLGMMICGTFVYVSLRHTTATNATLIYTTSPIYIILLERIFRGRPLRWKELAGIAIAFSGAAVIIARGDWGVVTSFSFNIGDVGVLAAAISWAIYSVILRNGPVAALPTAVSFTLIAAAGALIILPSWIVEGLRTGFIPTGQSEWASVFGVAIIASVGAFSSYQFGVSRIGPTVAGIFLYILPLYGVGLSIAFLGEQLHVYHGVGLVLVLTGVVIATTPGSRKVTAQTASG